MTSPLLLLHANLQAISTRKTKIILACKFYSWLIVRFMLCQIKYIQIGLYKLITSLKNNALISEIYA